MIAKGIIVAICLFFCASICMATSCEYFITVPRTVIAGSELDVSITVMKNGSQTMTMLAILKNSASRGIAGATKTVRGRTGKLETLQLKIPENTTSGSGYQIEISVSGWIFLHKTINNIYIKQKRSILFIETDRPIYKPGDLVQFRTFGINTDLKPLQHPLNITITDSSNNRVQQYTNVLDVFGVFGGSLQLSTVTNLGSWRIAAYQLNQRESVTFEVAEYELPTFEATISVPDIPHIMDDSFKIRITAIYTFGKPVEGYATIKIKRRWYKEILIEKTVKIFGRVDLKISTWDLYPVYGTSFSVDAVVNETVTGKNDTDSFSLYLRDSRWRVTFSPTMTSLKPGLSYNIVFRIEDYDGKPVKKGGLAKIIVGYDHIVPMGKSTTSRKDILLNKDIKLSSTGEVDYSVVFPPNTTSATIYVIYKQQNIGSKYIYKTSSPSGNFIQVRINGHPVIKVGERITFVVSTTENLRQCYYKVLSSGVTVKEGILKMNRRKQRKLRLYITRDMTPAARVLVYYIRPEGEIVADAITFPVNDIFENQVTIAFDRERAEPGQTVNLRMTADPGSLVNVAAVDKSILLLRGANDINAEEVISDVTSDDYFSQRLSRVWGRKMTTPETGSTANSVFQNSELSVISDCGEPERVVFHRESRPSMAARAGPGGPTTTFFVATRRTTFAMVSFGTSESATRITTAGNTGAELATPVRKRTNFQETWLWTKTTTSSSGEATLSVVIPDTITQWIASSYAINSVTGLGVAFDKANITTFQRFFIRLELPYSVIRGEMLILKISVFNYMESDQRVFVSLKNNANLTFVDENGDVLPTQGASRRKEVMVPKDAIRSVYFPIIPNRIGKTALDVTAQTVEVADAVKRDLLVKPEGIAQKYNLPVAIDLRDNRRFVTTLHVSFPPNVIPESEFIKVSVTGDLLGSTLDGIEDLLKMSYGCGEQNMLNFVPNVFVSEYLNVTHRFTAEIQKKVQKLLLDGYQRELSYSRYDGSYSAFGKSDKDGSTWLTAFVVKSFAQAAKFTFIDPNVMQRATQFLINKQLHSGQFTESGRVLHKEMQGGTAASAVSLTAYVVIALSETLRHQQIPNHMIHRTEDALRKGINFIAENLLDKKNVTREMYELVLSTYALTLQNASLANALLSDIEKRANNSDGQMFWVLPDDEVDKLQPYNSWSPPRKQYRALDIEVTAYMLLIYNTRNEISKGVQVVRWLNDRRNPYGGFVSTQDTVIAIQAISGLAEKIYSPSFNPVLTVFGNDWTGTSFRISNENSLVLQSVDAPPDTRKMTLDGSGTGFIYTEISVFFHVPEELRKPSFTLYLTVLNDSILGFRLRICFSWLRGKESTMGYLEITKPTGMDINQESINVTQAHGLFKKKENTENQLNMYFDAITEETMCVEVDFERISLVVKQKPVPVRISEYYEQSNEVIKMYQSEALARASLSDVCEREQCS